MSTESRHCVQVVNATETPHELVTRISTLRSRGPSNQSISGALNAYLDSHSLVINTGDLTGYAFTTYLYSCDGWRGSVMNAQLNGVCCVQWNVHGLPWLCSADSFGVNLTSTACILTSVLRALSLPLGQSVFEPNQVVT